MATNKTLLLLVAFMCLMSTARASIMLEKWTALMLDATFNNFVKTQIWLLWSTIGPIAAGLIRPAITVLFDTFSDDVKYGMSQVGLNNIDDLFAYFMNFILYTLIFKNLSVTYTDDEFYEFDLSTLGSLS